MSDLNPFSYDKLFTAQRKAMVEGQIQGRGVKDHKVLEAMRKVERHLFVPESCLAAAYEDYPLSIGHGQTISQPFIVAYMTEAVQLRADDKVLEIGTGCGYQAAILAEIVREVYSVEIIPELAQAARQRLQQLGYRNITVHLGNGFDGLQEYAPYDAILVTAAPKEIPRNLVRQLKIKGRMIIPIGSFSQDLYLVTRREKSIEEKLLLPVTFVPMVGEGKP